MNTPHFTRTDDPNRAEATLPLGEVLTLIRIPETGTWALSGSVAHHFASLEDANTWLGRTTI